MPRILGIDPGIRCLGWGVIDADGSHYNYLEAGVVRPSANRHLAERLLHIERALDVVIARHSPELCSLENVFYHKNPRSMLTLGQAQAAGILCAARAGMEVTLYTPREIKQAVTGRGGADKQQVRFMVERILGLRFTDEPDDLSDALAVAICHAGRFENAAREGKGALA
ncbi:MAG: crossover junction endodeoxyribonuclease RuvC [bacterium]|nr:crossover junction endodeoxyribonuclease RuvC [bacterium]